MSGGGVIIIIHHSRKALEDPMVSGELPPETKVAVDAVMCKPDHEWDDADKTVIGNAIAWALLNIK